MDCRDKGLELLAKRTRIDMEMKNSELEELNVEIPSDYHEDMLNFVRALDCESSKRKRKNRTNRWTGTIKSNFASVSIPSDSI